MRRAATPEPADNSLVLVGSLVRPVAARTTPGGIPISRFSLEHRSRQQEAGHEREVGCRIVVVAAGDELQAVTTGLHTGDRVRVEGFISRSSYRDEATQLVLHARRLERL